MTKRPLQHSISPPRKRYAPVQGYESRFVNLNYPFKPGQEFHEWALEENEWDEHVEGRPSASGTPALDVAIKAYWKDAFQLFQSQGKNLDVEIIPKIRSHAHARNPPPPSESTRLEELDLKYRLQNDIMRREKTHDKAKEWFISEASEALMVVPQSQGTGATSPEDLNDIIVFSRSKPTIGEIVNEYIARNRRLCMKDAETQTATTEKLEKVGASQVPSKEPSTKRTVGTQASSTTSNAASQSSPPLINKDIAIKDTAASQTSPAVNPVMKSTAIPPLCPKPSGSLFGRTSTPPPSENGTPETTARPLKSATRMGNDPALPSSPSPIAAAKRLPPTETPRAQSSITSAESPADSQMTEDSPAKTGSQEASTSGTFGQSSIFGGSQPTQSPFGAPRPANTFFGASKHPFGDPAKPFESAPKPQQSHAFGSSSAPTSTPRFDLNKPLSFDFGGGSTPAFAPTASPAPSTPVPPSPFGTPGPSSALSSATLGFGPSSATTPQAPPSLNLPSIPAISGGPGFGGTSFRPPSASEFGAPASPFGGQGSAPSADASPFDGSNMFGPSSGSDLGSAPGGEYRRKRIARSRARRG